MKLLITARARRDIARIEEWWSQHRAKSPLLFREELQEAFAHIEATPELARVYTSRAGKEYRKLPLEKTRQVVYFEVRSERGVVVVVAIASPVGGKSLP